MKSVGPNQESRDPTHYTVTPICVENQFRHVRVRLIGGDAELLMAMAIIENCV